ncbi:MAG: HAMP domain-containing sensor histidine kinase [Bacteroidota bacterium]|nr:HAMP domain-containing sensor histidine kinase [Bacteroidota bacterium]
MKLLTKTSLYYILFSMITFIIGGIIFYNTVKNIMYRQIDENLVTEQLLVEEAINITDTVPDYTSVFGHMIQVLPYIKIYNQVELIHDTAVYDSSVKEIIDCRHLKYIMLSTSKQGYTINIYKPLKNTKSMIAEIIFSITILFLSLMIILFIVNYFISRRAWIPFYRTLGKLSSYKVTQDESLKLPDSKIHEFHLLNETLEMMSQQIHRDYVSLKEFNENAAHELQTPLAIIKSKLDLLIQDQNLTPDQYTKIESAYEALRRISRLNQGLLLISRINNNQFEETEDVNIAALLKKLLDNFSELISGKNIHVDAIFNDEVILKMNPTLAEILLSNLLSNAIRYNFNEGWIKVELSSRSLVISNTGNPLKVSPRILFERFRKSSSTGDSVGLGLAIVNKIVLYYGMKIEFTSTDSIHNLKITF